MPYSAAAAQIDDARSFVLLGALAAYRHWARRGRAGGRVLQTKPISVSIRNREQEGRTGKPQQFALVAHGLPQGSTLPASGNHRSS